MIKSFFMRSLFTGAAERKAKARQKESGPWEKNIRDTSKVDQLGWIDIKLLKKVVIKKVKMSCF